jgi:ElaB/YqjD/DUF883 family membrane-anchored ribosome-binding protein
MIDRAEDETEQGEAAARADGGGRSFERVKPILNDLLDAARSTAETMLDDQKRKTAERVAGIAEAVRCAAQSLDRSESQAIARYADQAAHRIEDFSRLIRERRWSDIVADTEDFARRQPMLFVVGATVAGFLAGRLLSLPSDRRQPKENIQQPPDLTPHRGETDEITAAVSKLATQPTGGAEIAGNGDEVPVGLETR